MEEGSEIRKKIQKHLSLISIHPEKAIIHQIFIIIAILRNNEPLEEKNVLKHFLIQFLFFTLECELPGGEWILEKRL